ncbi:uncharacterized protein [Dermacentor andersoni]|uniref:uncharacterized protein n=1 Tax=Dermacentor andersoni TaxID=34620 RepID=UPI002417D6BA|nr:uncharacterized protein LOC129386074 [Dermacentor andersoni]
MKTTTETDIDSKVLPEPSKGFSAQKEPRPKPTRSSSKSESDDEEEANPEERRPRVSYYRKLMLPSGEAVDITKRNQFIREWKEKRLKCDPRPYYMLAAATALLLLLLYIYAYHQAVT